MKDVNIQLKRLIALSVKLTDSIIYFLLDFSGSMAESMNNKNNTNKTRSDGVLDLLSEFIKTPVDQMTKEDQKTMESIHLEMYGFGLRTPPTFSSIFSVLGVINQNPILSSLGEINRDGIHLLTQPVTLASYWRNKKEIIQKIEQKVEQQKGGDTPMYKALQQLLQKVNEASNKYKHKILFILRYYYIILKK